MRNWTTGLLVAAICLTAGSLALAQFQQRQTENRQEPPQARAQNAYASDIVICPWECSKQFNDQHTTQVQGAGLAPCRAFEHCY